MGTFHSLESRRKSAATRNQLALRRAAGGLARNGLQLKRAFLGQIDVLWVASAAQLGLKALRAALWIGYQASLRRRSHPTTWMTEIPCSARPPRFLAGDSRSFRQGVARLIAGGLLSRHRRDGQRTARYEIRLPTVESIRP